MNRGKAAQSPWDKYIRVPKRPVAEKEEGAATRTCLRCGQPFKSEWIGNRMCKNCSKRT